MSPPNQAQGYEQDSLISFSPFQLTLVIFIEANLDKLFWTKMGDVEGSDSKSEPHGQIVFRTLTPLFSRQNTRHVKNAASKVGYSLMTTTVYNRIENEGGCDQGQFKRASDVDWLGAILGVSERSECAWSDMTLTRTKHLSYLFLCPRPHPSRSSDFSFTLTALRAI